MSRPIKGGFEQRKEKAMTRKIGLLLLLVFISSPYAVAQLAPPKLPAAASTEKQDTLIKEGVVLHDHKDYTGAISKYEEVLRENPANVGALYELAYSYYAKQDYPRALDIAYQGAQYKSPQLAAFYTLIGNILDQAGDAKKAVEVYKAGIKLMPDEALLHYNLGLTYNTTGNFEEARKSVKQSVARNPNHASSHILLGTLFYKGSYKTPTLLALWRFLVLEPRSERAKRALQITQEILQGGVSPGKNGNEINIFVDMSAKKDEGDFGPIDLILGLSRAVGMTEKNKNKTAAELQLEQIDTLLAVMAEQSDKKLQGKFVGQYYFPYFLELKKRNYVAPFFYYINQQNDLPGGQQWLKDNQALVQEFLNWSKNYSWPKAA